MNSLRNISRLFIHILLVTFTALCVYAPASQAALISTEQILNQNQIQSPRSDLQQMHNRDNIRKQLLAMGVDSQDIQARIDYMTDQEAALLSNKMDQLPAGQGIVSTAAFVFVVLLITDILGYTDVFPFVKHSN